MMAFRLFDIFKSVLLSHFDKPFLLFAYIVHHIWNLLLTLRKCTRLSGTRQASKKISQHKKYIISLFNYHAKVSKKKIITSPKEECFLTYPKCRLIKHEY